MPQLRRPLLIFVVLCTIGFVAVPSAHSAEPATLQWLSLPEPCNAVTVIQMRKLVESPLGKKEKWIDDGRRSYVEGLLSAPSWVNEVVRATTVGASIQGSRTAFSIYAMNQASLIGDMAQHELAPAEEIAGSSAVLSRRNVYYVQLAPGLLGAVQPANRQALARWVRAHHEGTGVQISRYLKQAIESPDHAQIVVAVDLSDLLNRQRIRNWLASTPQLSSIANPDALASLMASVLGLRLSVNVTDTIVGRLRLDFPAPVGPHAEALRAAILQWLDDAGARIEVLSAAKVTVSGNSLSFEGPLDERALRHLLSLIQSPHLPAGPGGIAAGQILKPNAEASADYYNSVCDLLNALIRKNRDASNYDKTALWHEQYARRIAELPTGGVDPALLNWGRDISGKLVALAGSLRGVPVEVNQLEKSIRYEPVTYSRMYQTVEYGPLYLPYDVEEQSNLAGIRARQAEVVAKNADQRSAIWNLMRENTAQIAQQIEQKYQMKLKLPQ